MTESAQQEDEEGISTLHRTVITIIADDGCALKRVNLFHHAAQAVNSKTP